MAINTLQVDMQRIVNKTKRKLQTVIHEFSQDMNFEVVQATPVDTGNLRGSWYVSVNTVNAQFLGKEDKQGGITVARMNLGVLDAKIGDVIYFLNNASYASYVENGTFKMTPRLFVKGTVNRAPMIAERTIKRIAMT